jgi:hypothetical protein
MQEIFSIAYYLHWSREEILNLPILERRRYLELLADRLRQEQGAARDNFQ